MFGVNLRRSLTADLNCCFWIAPMRFIDNSFAIWKEDVSSRTVINQIGTTSFFAQHILLQSLHSILAAGGTILLKARGKLWNWLLPILFLVGSVFFIENWLLRYCWCFLSPITILTFSETRIFSGKFQTAVMFACFKLCNFAQWAPVERSETVLKASWRCMTDTQEALQARNTSSLLLQSTCRQSFEKVPPAFVQICAAKTHTVTF